MRVLVTGATSMIGDYLIPLLVRSGMEVVALSRSARDGGNGVTWVKGDLESTDWIPSVDHADAWINLAALKYVPGVLEPVATKLGISRLVAFGSTSMFTKADANDANDLAFAKWLAEGEEAIRAMCPALKIDWTIIRPTLIYSFGRDRNITFIANRIRTLKIFPLIGNGHGLRQPVHAEDLAIAAHAILLSGTALNKAYNLSGAEVLTYRELVTKIFERLGMEPRFIRVPLWIVRIALRLLRLLPPFRYLTPDMADRMEKDMTFSHEEARKDFGFDPRPFQP